MRQPHTVTAACRRFVDGARAADRWEFARSVRQLLREIPSPETSGKREGLRLALLDCALRSAFALHEQYHRIIRAGDCTTFRLDSLALFCADAESDPRVVFRRWGRAFLRSFDGGHPWPAVFRAAADMRERFREPGSVEALGRRFGMSRAVFTRVFRQYYGTSPVEYRNRARLRWAIEELRAPGSTVEVCALGAGYRSIGAFYDALRRATGLAPADVRRLSDRELAVLFDNRLSLEACRGTGLRGSGPEARYTPNSQAAVGRPGRRAWE